MENKKEEISEKNLPLWKQKVVIPIKIISDEIGNKEEIHKYSFNRKTRREIEATERTQPEKDRKFKIKLNLQEGKQAHQKAIREKQARTHLKCLANKIKKPI